MRHYLVYLNVNCQGVRYKAHLVCRYSALVVYMQPCVKSRENRYISIFYKSFLNTSADYRLSVLYTLFPTCLEHLYHMTYLRTTCLMCLMWETFHL